MAQAVTNDSTAVELTMERGLALMAQGDLDAAESQFLEVLRSEPQQYLAPFQLGRIYLERKHWAPAAGYLAQAYKLAPDVWQVGALFGYCLWKLGDFVNAVQLFARITPLIPDEGASIHQHLVCRVMSKALVPDHDPALWSRVGQYLLSFSNSVDQIDFLKSCGFDRSAPATHNENIFGKLVLPLIHRALQNGALGFALDWHRYALLNTALYPHTQAQWAKYLDRLNPLFAQAGAALRARVGPWAPTHAVGACPVVALVFEESVAEGSGYTLFLSLLVQFAKAGQGRYAFTVYCTVAPPVELRKRCRTLGMACVDFSGPEHATPWGDAVAAQLLAMRERSQVDGVALAVLFSAFEASACLMAAFGIAPRHAYYTMMFHSINSPGLDVCFASASLDAGHTHIHGRAWRTLPPALPYPFPSPRSQDGRDLAANVKEVRRTLKAKYSSILGTIGRTEKLDDAFIGVVAELLKGNPGAVFLWFGHPDGPLVQPVAAKFKAHGVGERCLFMGWTDTRLFAQVLDVHLDSFCQPTGMTMAQTFSAGRAYVLKRGPEADLIGMTPLLASLQDVGRDAPYMNEARAIFTDADAGTSLMMLAASRDDYVALANRLIRDEPWRAKVGQAAKAFMDRFFHDSDHMGRMFVTHLDPTLKPQGAALGTDNPGTKRS